MILVTGASGTTGGQVARQLIAAGQKPRLLARDLNKVRGLFPEGQAEIVAGDLSQPASLGAAMAGIERVYLASSGLEVDKLEGNAIDAAKAAGVKHVVKLSVMGADTPMITFAKMHAKSEEHIRRSGLAWTMLRPGNFMSNALNWCATVKTQGAFYQPTADGRWAAIDPADIGAVAVRALTTPGHEGKVHTLTGPESLSGGDYATKLSAALGKPVKFVDVPPEAAKDGMLQSGIPAAYVDALLELMAVMKAGHTNVVTDGVEKALGRKPGTFDAWVRGHLDAFR